jgi:predicted RNA-binding Zn ribbon-like protein
MDVSEAARLLASLRRPKNLVCPECGKEFVGRGRKKYCSYACSHRAAVRNWYRRRRAAQKGESARTTGPVSD